MGHEVRQSFCVAISRSRRLRAPPSLTSKLICDAHMLALFNCDVAFGIKYIFAVFNKGEGARTSQASA
jgi:hypothetical protein